MSPTVKQFWAAFLRQCPDPEDAQRRFCEVFSIGGNAADADLGAREILRGRKTTTSSLLWELEASGGEPPNLGSLSIVIDGSGAPVCVVETVWLETIPFDQVGADFARDYGEWDGSLETWQSECWAYYRDQCEALGRAARPDMPLVCERFRVVFTGGR